MKPFSFVFTFPVEISSIGNGGCQPHNWKTQIMVDANDLAEARQKFRMKMQSAVGEIADSQPDYFDELTKND